MVRPADDDPDEMLAVALQKARHLVSELEREAAELKSKVPALPAEKLALGEIAMTNALASARRMLKALEEAIAIKEKGPEDS